MFHEVSFHDGPTQKSIKQRPDKCSQPEPPGPRPDQAAGRGDPLDKLVGLAN